MKYAINLIAKKEAPLTERIIYFSLNYFRYIIIITQLVVIGVFFYRFQIDQRIIDLKESVDQKKEIMQVVLPLLHEADSIDKRTKKATAVIDSQKKFASMLQYYLMQFPATINLDSLTVNSDKIQVTGNAYNSKDLQAFLALLKKERHFASVDLKSIKKQDAGYLFTMVVSKFQ